MNDTTASIYSRKPVPLSAEQHESLHGRRRRCDIRALLACFSAIIIIISITCIIIKVSSLVYRGSPDRGIRSPVEVVPLQCHSHNDYWREKPLFSALEAGCVGLEADIWPYEDDLYVAHSRGSMQPGHTLKTTYLDPLLQLLHNANNAESHSFTHPSAISRGVYTADPAQTLVLLVDIKSNAKRAWPILIKQLEPLRELGWLSMWEDGHMTTAPVTVVATGDLPFEAIQDFDGPSNGVFLDAPLLGLGSDLYHPNNSHWASVSFRKSVGLGWFGNFGAKQLEKVRQHVKLAHSHGLKVRYWALPYWPIGLRNHVWGCLLAEGLDILNVDDLKGVTEFWSQGKGA